MVKKSAKRGRKKGLSPVVTTILLVALTIAIVVIIFFWFRGMVQEGVTKFNPPKNIQLVCDDVQFDASYSSGILNVVNTGSVPIFRVNLKITSQNGNYQTKDITDLNGGNSWPSSGLTSGAAFSGSIGSDPSLNGATDILVLPVLIGTSSSGKKTYVCGGQYGKDITL